MARFFKSKLFLLTESAVLVFVIIAFINISNKSHSIENEINSLKSKIEEENQNNASLSKRLAVASSDSYKVLQAKRSLNYKRPEETVFVFYQEPFLHHNNSAEQTVLEQKTSLISNPVAWWRYFFKQ